MDIISGVLKRRKAGKHTHEIPTPSWNHLWRSLVEFCLILKSDSTRDNFSKFLEVKLSPQKCLRWVPKSAICLRKDLSMDVALHVIVKNTSLKGAVMLFNFSMVFKSGILLWFPVTTRRTLALACWKSATKILEIEY